MSASNAFETAILQLIFQNVDISNIGDATGLRGSPTAGSLYVSLHTADPGEAGTQATNETAYTGYLRVAVVRSVVGFLVAGSNVSNVGTVTFPICAALPGAAVTHFGIGTAASGAGTLLLSGPLSASYAISIGNAPLFAIGGIEVDVE
jgi:hypothetical protein